MRAQGAGLRVKGPLTPGSPPHVRAVMKKLAKAIENLDEPAVERIAREGSGAKGPRDRDALGGVKGAPPSDNEEQENPFHVLISTMLSAQTRDEVTYAASTRLFRRARTPKSMAALTTKQIEKLIYPVSFYRNKAVHVKETCRQILKRYAGKVPDTMDEMLTLPGVGRKTANLVLILAHASRENICVDTHVHRISNRLGWVRARTPEQTEQALYRVTPKKWWPSVNLYLVTWGQNVCRPVYPRCPACVLADICPKIGVRKVGKT